MTADTVADADADVTGTGTDVVVVGGGPAGLAAATGLARAGLGVVVVEREPVPGGVSVHVEHTGYGVREFGRPLTGPGYAAAWTARAARAGAEIRTSTTVTGWVHDDQDWCVTVVSPRGPRQLRTRAVLLATGTRERSRSARLVAGTRPQGVLTTGSLQRLAAAGLPVGRVAVVVGAEHVSFSAVMALAHTGARTVAVVTDQPSHQTYAPFRVAAARGVPIRGRTRVVGIRGRRRVEAVELLDLDSDAVSVVACDTVVFTGDWVANHELARAAGLIMAPTGLLRVDGSLRTSATGVFAAGNLLHGAETAGVCARSGAWAGRAILAWLRDDRRHWPAAVALEAEGALAWVSPNAVVAGNPAVPHGHLLARSTTFARRAVLTATQADRLLTETPLRRLVPNRSLHLPARWLANVEPVAPVRLRLDLPA